VDVKTSRESNKIMRRSVNGKIVLMLLSAAVALCSAGSLLATPFVLQLGSFSGNGFRASYMHTATGGHHDGFYMSGGLSGKLGGNIYGDLDGDMFSITGGSIYGPAGVFGSDPLNIDVSGGVINLSMGATDQAGTTIIGGYVGYSGITADGSTVDGAGNFYLHNQLHTGDPDNPGANSYDRSAGGNGFLGWGQNWMNSNVSWEGIPLPDDPIMSGDGEGFTQLGIDLGGDLSAVPEPAALIQWALMGLTCVGMVVWRQSSKIKS
jgi:hypothetical protein